MQGKKARTAAGAAAAGAAATCLLAAAVPDPAQAADAPAMVKSVPCSAAALASAVRSANNGDTLSLAARCAYRQAALPAVAINLTIAGNGATLADSSLEVDASTLTVTSLNFRRSRLLVKRIGAATVTGGTFSGGTSVGNGGAIDDEGGETGQLIVTGATFAGNTAADSGGAIYDFGYGNAQITRCTFTGNRAGNTGGAVSVSSDGTSRLSNLVMRGNSAAIGGAVADDTVGVITGGLITGNHASIAGGGIYSSGSPGQLRVTGSVLGQNTAPQGAAIYVDDGGSADIAHATITHNNASVSGGAIYNNGIGDGTVTLTDSRISYNKAGALGGGIYSGQGQVAVSGTVISRNTATAGGGIYSGGGAVTLTRSPVVHNTPDNCEPAVPGCSG